MGTIVALNYDQSFKHLFFNEEVRRYFISDVLGIPLERIHSTKLANTFLWRRYKKQKQGILDILILLNDDSKVNIELQVKVLAHWDKRSLFYLSKTFSEDLLTGENYSKLKKCICISILGFNLDQGPEYHKVYRLRDEAGHEYSDMLEIHVIELNKPLTDNERIDDWIRLFNVKTEEELNMLQNRTKNPGILEAISEVRAMNLVKTLRVLHDAHMKEIRDRNARDDYVRNEGLVQGRAEGRKEGKEEGENRLNRLILLLIADNRQKDLERAAKDKQVREQLYKEYNI